MFQPGIDFSLLGIFYIYIFSEESRHNLEVSKPCGIKVNAIASHLKGRASLRFPGPLHSALGPALLVIVPGMVAQMVAWPLHKQRSRDQPSRPAQSIVEKFSLFR